MGSFPIQSNTGAQDDWVTDGKTALIVPPEDPAEVEAAIRRAVRDDALVDSAAEENARTVERVEQRLIQPQVVELYKHVASQPLDRRRR
jgi:glycosyltransferase involved in cell wall biosynthesis